MKCCSACRESKPLDDFHRDKYQRDGYRNICKPCACEITRQWQDMHPDATRARKREWQERNRPHPLLEPRLPHPQRDGFKRCPDCRTIKPVGAFKLNRTRADGVHGNCRPCERERKLMRLALKRTTQVKRVRRDVVLRWGHGICGICGEPVDPADFHVDHIVPLSKGGPHTYDNVQPAHPLCNMRKQARLVA